MKHYTRFLFVVLLVISNNISLFAGIGEMIIDNKITYYIKDTNSSTTCSVLLIDEDVVSLNIPSTFKYSGRTYTVNQIEATACAGCTKLRTVKIPSTVTTILDRAFSGCTQLSSIVIPNTVTFIGDDAFKDCKSLSKPLYNNTIFAYMPTNYDGRYIVPDGISQIIGSAFRECKSLTSIELPSSLTSIGDEAFYGCSKLKYVVNHSVLNVEKGSKENGYIGYYANVIAKVKEGDFYFDDVEKTQLVGYDGKGGDISIPNTVKTIGPRLFFDCAGLTSVNIPNSVKTIGEYAFSGCSSLSSISLPNTITEIGLCWFYGCSNLKTIEIPNSVLSIGAGAFEGCTSLNTINIPKSVTEIKGSAFSGCTNLEYVDIPQSVTYVGDGIFSGCSKLKFLEPVYTKTQFVYMPRSYEGVYSIPDGITRICGEAFSECSKLSEIMIPESVAELGPSAYKKCSGLTSVILPNTVTKIGEYAFSGCTDLTSFKLPNTITEIGKGMFHSCVNLSSIVIPSSVVGIGLYAFYGCTNLKSVVIGSSVAEMSFMTIMGETRHGFNGCTSISKLTLLPKSVSGYSADVLADLALPTEGRIVHVPNDSYNGMVSGTIKKYDYLNSYFEVDGSGYVPISPSERTCALLDYNAVDDAKEIKIGESVEYRGLQMNVTELSPYLFIKNDLIKSIEVEAKADIPDFFAYQCKNLEKVAFGSEVKNVGKSAFGGCTKIKEIYTAPTTPPACDESVFEDIDKWNCTLYVPKEAVSQYRSADQWKDFFFIEAYEFPNGIFTPSVSRFRNNGRTYNLQGVEVDKDSNGILIRNGKKFVVD